MFGQISFLPVIFLPHSAPSWILSLAENLASSSLQDGATKWLYYLTKPPHPHPDHTSFFLINSVRCPHPSMNIWTQVHVRCPPLILSSMWCYVRCPHPSINIWTHFLVRCPPWFWIVCSVPNQFLCAVSPPPISILESYPVSNSSYNSWNDTLKWNFNLA